MLPDLRWSWGMIHLQERYVEPEAMCFMNIPTLMLLTARGGADM